MRKGERDIGRPRGRPLKFSAEKAAEIVKALQAGNYLETACHYVGLERITVFEWLKRGNAEKKGKYHDFSYAVRRAAAEAEMRDVQLLQQATRVSKRGVVRNIDAVKWRLEHRHPQRWGRTTVDTRIRAKVTVGREVDFSKLTDEELFEYVRLYEKAMEGGDGKKQITQQIKTDTAGGDGGAGGGGETVSP